MTLCVGGSDFHVGLLSALPALVLTDSNALYGALEFVSECRKVSIAPILGTELNLTSGCSIVLLAQNMQGYGNLCRLITHLQAAPDRDAALTRGLALTDLAPHTDGLIALSGGQRGLLDAHLDKVMWPKLKPSHTYSAASLVKAGCLLCPFS